jgi:hypothetical protein
VPLGFDVPEWRALHEALRKLADDAGAHGGAIVDVSYGVWCSYGNPGFRGILVATQNFLEREMTPVLRKQLQRGAKWSIVRDDADCVG